jgi:hypothetical protein
MEAELLFCRDEVKNEDHNDANDDAEDAYADFSALGLLGGECQVGALCA